METESFTVQKQTGLNSLTVAICSTASQNWSLKCVKYGHLNRQVQYTMKTLEVRKALVSPPSPSPLPSPLPPKSSQQSRTHISLNTTSDRLRKERGKHTKQMFFGYTMRVRTPVWVKIICLPVINLWYHHHTPWQVESERAHPVSWQSPAGRERNPTLRTPGWWRSCEWGCSTGTWAWARRSGRRAAPIQCAVGSTGHLEVHRHWCLSHPPSLPWTLAWPRPGADCSWLDYWTRMDSPAAVGSVHAAILSKVWHWPRGLYCPAVPSQMCWGFFCCCSWWCHKSLSLPWHPFPQGWKGWCDYRRCLLGFLPVTLASSICQNVPVHDIHRCSGLICLALQKKPKTVQHLLLDPAVGKSKRSAENVEDILNDERQ